MKDDNGSMKILFYWKGKCAIKCSYIAELGRKYFMFSSRMASNQCFQIALPGKCARDRYEA